MPIKNCEHEYCRLAGDPKLKPTVSCPLTYELYRQAMNYPWDYDTWQSVTQNYLNHAESDGQEKTCHQLTSFRLILPLLSILAQLPNAR